MQISDTEAKTEPQCKYQQETMRKSKSQRCIKKHKYKENFKIKFKKMKQDVLVSIRENKRNSGLTKENSSNFKLHIRVLGKELVFFK